ncbi:MAG: DUF6144 family protein [Acetatifactor sp.]
MAKNDNPHAVRLQESMITHGESAAAEQFAASHPLSKSANIEKKFAWAQSVCEFLSGNYDDEKVKAIRMDCACGPELGKGKKLREIFEKESDARTFVEKVNRLNQGFTMEFDGKYFYLIYPQCYCSCVKRMEQTLPETWCYCTLGYTKRMFENIFDGGVKVELMGSVKLGNENCRIRIERVGSCAR